MTRILVLLLALLTPSWAWATEYWVTSAGSGTTTGTSYANAFAGWADVTGLAAGDTLHICGTITTSTELQWNTAGTAAAHIILTGVCTEGTSGTLDGNAAAAPVLNVRFSYVDVTYLTVTNSFNGATGHCLMFGSAGGGAGYNIASYNTIHACPKEGIHTQKSFTTIDHNTVYNIGENGISHSSGATNPTITFNNVDNFSTLGALGDGIEQATAVVGDATISDNTVTFRNYNVTNKAGIKLGNTTSGVVTAERNTVTCVPSASYPTQESRDVGGIFAQSGNILLRNNFITGCRNAITMFNDSATPFVDVQIIGNVCDDNYICVRLTPNVGTPTFTVNNNTSRYTPYGLSSAQTGGIAITVKHFNNLWQLTSDQNTLSPKGYGLLISASTTYTGNGNLIYPQGTDFINNAVCGGTVYATMAAYKAACTQEAASVSSDPLFVSTTDFRLRGTSPARGIGIPYGTCRDYANRACPPDRNNAGAYQDGSGRQAGARTARTP